jgi:hypothetical protein
VRRVVDQRKRRAGHQACEALTGVDRIQMSPARCRTPDRESRVSAVIAEALARATVELDRASA